MNITMSGPADAWFGIGFNATDMPNAYSIICSNEKYCFEQLLAYGSIGQRLPQQHISTISDVTQNGVRTVELTRKQIITQDDDANYENIFQFPSHPMNVPIIYSYGTNDIFKTNQSHMANAGVSSLMFTNSTNRQNITASLNLFTSVDQSIEMKIFPNLNNMQITFNGPSSLWYGIGFGSQQMNNTYAIIVDADGSVSEYILGPGLPGNKLLTQSIVVSDSVITNGVRKVTMNRPISVVDATAYTFPVSPSNISIIASYGTPGLYNESSMANATVSMMEFTPFNASGGGNVTNNTICKPGVEKYGIDGNVGDGFAIGLFIFCKDKTIRLSVVYDDYDPNWFGIVFNTKMAPSHNSTIFTTGKPSETQSPIGLYSYDLASYSTSGVVYHPERNWRNISQTISDKTVSIVYEQDLRYICISS